MRPQCPALGLGIIVGALGAAGVSGVAEAWIAGGSVSCIGGLVWWLARRANPNWFHVARLPGNVIQIPYPQPPTGPPA